MPAQNPGAEQQPVRKNARSGPDVKERARVLWKRFARWAGKNGREARVRAGAAWEKFFAATAAGRERLGSAAAAGWKKFSAAAAAGRERLCGTAGWKKLCGIAAIGWEKLSGAVSAGWEKLSRVAGAGRRRLYGTAGWKKFSREAEKFRGLVARHPISPLLYVTLLAVGIGAAAFQNSYARAFELEVNGQKVGLVSGEDEVNAILSHVETRAASVGYEVEVTLSPVYAAPGALSDAAEVEDALFGEMGAYAVRQTYAAVSAGGEDDCIHAWAISVDGVEMGCAASKDELYQMLDELAQPYLPENAVRYEFVEDVQVYPVELPLGAGFDLGPVREELSALRVEEAVYVVKAGDTFNAIARSLDMEPIELSVLNPDVMVDLLWIDQELVIQRAVPRLSVLAVTSETYEQVVPSPVEYIETADLYVGDAMVMAQGEDGLALVDAEVTYVNNVEQSRKILESSTLKESVTTYTYIGTTERPATASRGYFIWPVSGIITSYFGGRDLWGSYDYHTGLDIGADYGTSIVAADGGTVTTAGWSGGYGNLVVIQHDNGMLTYYGHNTSVLVNVGDKVYQGQVIATAGATGKADGPHCHFELRVNGASVNPLNYLR